MQQRIAGVMIPLFSLRTTQDLGRGEIGGLIPMADFALAMGHRMIQILPIDETARGETSPYSAMSVMAIDPLYISVRGLDGIDAADIAAARALAGPGDPPDTVKFKAARMELLSKSQLYFAAKASPDDRHAFEEFEDRNREWLHDYALFRALKEKFGWSAWTSWPDGLDRHAGTALKAAARECAPAISKYIYTQFVAHRQWGRMHAELGRRGVMVGGDLAFSPACESAEVWANQKMFDLGRTVGSPPDAFSKTGQRWGLPMPNWERMRAADFALIRMRIRHARELFDLVRIDHVVGLYRTYGFRVGPVAEGAFDPVKEADQRAQGKEIVRAVKQEAGPMAIIAEDLGVIPPFVRKSLKALGVPGYKVMRWEREWDTDEQAFVEPSQYPELSVATTGTHDTTSLVEWWREADADERSKFVETLKLAPAIEADCDRLDERAIDAILGSLYAGPSYLTIVPVQDLFGWDVRINTPGTVDEINWKWRLPFALDRWRDRPELMHRVAALRMIVERTGRDRGLHATG